MNKMVVVQEYFLTNSLLYNEYNEMADMLAIPLDGFFKRRYSAKILSDAH